MPPPVSYTEQALAEFMLSELGVIGSILGYSAVDLGDFEEAVNQTLLIYGADDIATISGAVNIRKLRAIARVQAFVIANRDTSGMYDFSADGGSYSRSQINDMIRKGLEDAESEATAVGVGAGYSIARQALTWSKDPYHYLPDDELPEP